MKKKCSLLGASLLALCLLTACQQTEDPLNTIGSGTKNTKDPSETTDPNGSFVPPSGTVEITEHHELDENQASLYVERSGKLVSVDVESFDKPYYDKDEFVDDFLKPSIVKFNTDTAGLPYATAAETEKTLPVTITDVTREQDKIRMQLTFKDADTYLAFNKDHNGYYENWNLLVSCTYSEAMDKGLSFEGSFVDAAGSPVTKEQIQNTKGLYVLAVNYAGDIPGGFSGYFQIEGEILYRSSDVYQQSDSLVKTSAGDLTQYVFYK